MKSTNIETPQIITLLKLRKEFAEKTNGKARFSKPKLSNDGSITYSIDVCGACLWVTIKTNGEAIR